MLLKQLLMWTETCPLTWQQAEEQAAAVGFVQLVSCCH